MGGNGVMFPFLVLASLVALLYVSFGHLALFNIMESKDEMVGFVRRNGSQFVLDGRAFYVNGWNSYWLMDQAVENVTRPRVTAMFRSGAEMGLTVCRTWAFNDGTYRALQVSLGLFDEEVFKGLDRVILEAQNHGIKLLLSLTNNLPAYGGKTQYVKWAWEEGIGSSTTNDSFFFDPDIRYYFKLYLKTILTRKNHLTGIEYRDDPTIFAWELMNEPRCVSDPSGDTVQDWIEEMAGYVKSIDKKHLLTIGLEGFYGPTSSPEKLKVNPGEWCSKEGTDFIRNSKIPAIDFASAHVYPDQWLYGAELDDKIKFIHTWVTSHIEDGEKELKKPVLFTEFGISNKYKDFHDSHRDDFCKALFDIIYDSAQNNRAGAGAFIWQLMLQGMEIHSDDYGIVAGERTSIYRLIKQQSCRLSAINHSWLDKAMIGSRAAC